MESIYNQRVKMTDFIRDNKQNFQDKLLSEAVNVAS
jgi:rsbT co-antagonist protein RsbR